MRLKRLELAGFKTFADRTALEFAPRLTAIVGPNGSGKSNIFDAVRWALGEGNLRSLRGVRNEDVIFAGSDRRRALAMAEVTLTLDNADGTLMMPAGDGNGNGEEAPTPLAFAEVTVSRRALRAADSQYAINTLPCRLRDIQTMFLGTGLGGHTYALVSQGEVDRMLDATPEERRMILEEAAGLARFKRRRHDAERRMAAADQLLLRVMDILAEQDARVTQLAAQAEAAQQYQAHTQELRGLELAVQVEEVRRLARAQKRVRDQLDQAAARRREIDEALGRLAAEREALDRRAAEAGREWDEAQRSLVRLTERRAAEDAQAQLLAERRRGIRLQQDRLTAEVARLHEEKAALRGQRADLEAADRALDGERASIVKAVSAAEARLRALEEQAAQGEARLERDRAEARTLSDARSHARGEAAAAGARAAASRDRAEALAERIAHLRGAAAETETRRAALAGDVDEITAALGTRQETLRALRTEHARGADGREEALADLRRGELERETVRSRLVYLEEAHAQYRGYDAGARELLLARQRDPQRFRALAGTVAEALRVPRDLRAAVEAALGPHLSALVVSSVEDVQALREVLGGTDPGSAAFLPVSLLRARPAEPLPGPTAWANTSAAASDPGVVGVAADLVQPDAHPEIARALLGDVLVVRDLASALRLRAAGHAGRLVTLAGEALSVEGVITTGRRTPAQAGVLGRADEIAEARAALARLEESVREGARRAEDAASRLRAVETALGEADAAVSHEADRRAEAQRRLVLLEAEVARVQEELGLLAADHAQASAHADGQDAERERLDAEAGAIDQRIAGIEADAVERTARLRGTAQDLKTAREVLTEARVAVTGLEGRRATLRAQTAELSRGLEALDARARDLIAEADGLGGDEGRLAGEEDEARARGGAIAAEAARLEAGLQALDTERAAVAARRTDLEAQHGETRGRLEALAEDAHRIELRQAQVEAEAASARRRIEEEFGQPYDAAAVQVAAEVDRDETLGRIEALRGLIAALGPVNLIAIEEHRQAAARAAALRAQYDDVQGTLAALRGLITDLEGVIRGRFDETFRAVNDEFSELFVRLFGGGRAGLSLVEVEGSDEPGVDLEVQPPGKNLRSLGALSGGERVMVALALIFAMLRVRPSPFCVFDEIEAALDEANTRKVAQVLQELAERTQIIIITHNKATMEACDALFGVTMEEPGVSHMVSVQFHEADRLREEQPVG